MSAEAIAIIEQAREIHVRWAEYLDGDPHGAAELVPRVRIAGDADHHREWVRKYDVVLGALNGQHDVAAKALDACLQYDHWKREIDRLGTEISECLCPNEPGPHRDDAPHPADWEAYNAYTAGVSCFTKASDIRVGGSPEDPPHPLSLDAVEREVADCPACSRLCDLIRERKHARQRWGVAKRAVRHVARKARRES